MAEENNGNVNIYGTIFAQQEDGKAAYANQVYDSTQEKFQGEINNDIVEFMNGTYTKEEVDALVEADTTPTEDSEKLITSGGVYNAYNELDAKIDESFQHQVYLEDDSGTTPIPSFDPQADTIHKAAQVLSNGEQKQVRQNIGLGNGDFATAQDFNNPTALQKKQVPTVGAIVEGVQHIIGNNAIKTNESQSLTDSQKAQAMSNMGVDEELALGAIYDVSAKNGGATFASLEALLNDANLNTLIPTSVRRGGMSIKFVLTSDKYVQCFLTKDEWSVSEDDWQKLNLEEEVSQLGQEVFNELHTEVYNELVFENYLQGYIRENGNITDTESTAYRVYYFPCVKGDKFKLKYSIFSATSARTYGVYSAENASDVGAANLIEVGPVGTAGTEYEITISNDSAKWVCITTHYRATEPHNDWGATIKKRDYQNNFEKLYNDVEENSISAMLKSRSWSISGNVVYDSNDIPQSYNITWDDGTAGTIVLSNFNDDVFEYTTITATYQSMTIVYVLTYDENGYITNETINIQ